MDYLDFLLEKYDRCETYNEMVGFLVTEALQQHLLLQSMLHALNEKYDIQFQDLIDTEEMEAISVCKIEFSDRPDCCCEVDDFDEDEIEFGTNEDLEYDDDDEKYDVDEVARLVGELYQELTKQKGKH